MSTLKDAAQQLIDRKLQLEKDVMRLLNGFYAETGLSAQHIEITATTVEHIDGSKLRLISGLSVHVEV